MLSGPELPRRVPRRKHVPRRSCLGCGGQDDQNLLIRLVLTQAGDLKLAPRGRGRGGYLHSSEDCWRAFLRKKNLFRAFHAKIEKAAKEKLVLGLKERNRE